MATLVLLCAFTFVSAVGVSGWEGVVFDEAGGVSDSPLPLALQQVGTEKHPLYNVIIGFGIFGLVANNPTSNAPSALLAIHCAVANFGDSFGVLGGFDDIQSRSALLFVGVMVLSFGLKAFFNRKEPVRRSG